PWPVAMLLSLVVGVGGGMLGALSIVNDRDVDARQSTQAAPPAPAPSGIPPEQVPAPLPAGGTVARVADVTLPSVVQILAEGKDREATGSGFVLDRRGRIITNNHVIAEAADDAGADGSIVVVFDDESRVRARVVGRSPAYDIAVLALRRRVPVHPAAIADIDHLQVGQTVVAIGAPLGLSSTVTSGIVSAMDRPVSVGGEGEASYINAIQTDAAINPGNSGGPLVNLQGQVVGVNSAIATLGGFGGSGSIGVGFAIPIDQVLRTAEQLLTDGEASYPVIGASVDVNTSLRGARITAVTPASPAAAAGLRDDDLVVRLDDQQINDGIELIVAIRSRLPGETVRLVYRREGELRTAVVTLDEKVG
ncbi:MAG: trypsin-like peptidase domain-containing protein, partial [Actinomycetota bacterium]|nr:trypsin-like peptidase domain-containing protein [Actinomycetota bacterium]